MPKPRHTHKLKLIRFKSTGSSIYICVLDCSYKITPQLGLGKKTVCWRCGKDFSLNEYALRLARPHCDECHQHKKKAKEIEEEEITPPIPSPLAQEILSDMSNLTLEERLALAVGNTHLPSEVDEEEL